MLQFDNRWRVLQAFFDEPTVESGHQLREISRKIKLAPISVKKYLLELKQENLILEKKHRLQNYPLYQANRDNAQFKFYKRIDLLLRINNSGLLQKIKDELMPNVIILFGSGAKGEDTENSDIDLFVAATAKKMNLQEYEKELKRTINILYEPKFNRLSPELRNNLLNGIILSGSVQVF